MPARSRPVPVVGDAVRIQYLGSSEPGHIVAVEGRRVLVESRAGSEWFELSKLTGRFVRDGATYFPRLSWGNADPPEAGRAP